MQESVQVDIGVFDAEPDDFFLLCSDGLSGMLEDDQLLGVIQSSTDPDVACRRLIDAANEHGGEDNVTAVLLRLEEASDDEMRATIPDAH